MASDGLRVLSLFSGAGGMDLGLERAGHQLVGLCEIDRNARFVLARHWPTVPLHDNVTTLDGNDWRGRVDLVSGGSPCQDLSVAGRRDGLAGNRSGLFWHQCRIAAECAAPWILWENVPGALTSNHGADFAAVLWGLTGALPNVPDGGWRSIGVVVGNERFAVWRVFDARWFNVPQRRRRVFVVSGPATELRRGVQILVEPESVPGCAHTGHTSRQDAPPPVVGSVGGGVPFVKRARAQSVSDVETWEQLETSPTLNAMDNTGDARATVITLTPISFGWQENHYAGNARTDGTTDPLTTSKTLGVVNGSVPRRLTPIETERLMGWPDDWTRWKPDGTELPDSSRYKLCGNGVVAPVAEWIGRRFPARMLSCPVV